VLEGSSTGLLAAVCGVFAQPIVGTDPGQMVRGGRERMNDATQQRLVTILAVAIAYLISQYITDRLVDIPEERGVKDDAIEAVLKGATTATSTILASILVRRLFRT
jgi:hypothetical protein